MSSTERTNFIGIPEPVSQQASEPGGFVPKKSSGASIQGAFFANFFGVDPSSLNLGGGWGGQKWGKVWDRSEKGKKQNTPPPPYLLYSVLSP